MSEKPDGYHLIRQLRSSYPIPSTLMVDTLVSLEADMRMALDGRSIPIEQWVQWVRQDRNHADAVLRVLFLVVTIRNVSIDDVHALWQRLREQSATPRRQPKPIRETGPRESPRLW